MILIIGGGLSGLLAGYRLKQKGTPFRILEARDRIGGRIDTISAKNETPVEMGATWFNKQHHLLIQLLEELEIGSFEQFMKGTAFYEAFSNSPAQPIQIPDQEPSYRIAGGSNALIIKLAELISDEIGLNEEVTAISMDGESVIVKANKTYIADKVVLALPPKLWSKKIHFEPSLPSGVSEIAAQTHTWMEDSTKVALIYKEPFWKQAKQSGTLFSNVGPLVEFYDHSNAEDNKHALCGFLNPNFNELSLEERKSKISEQLVGVFGPKASNFIDYKECDWSEENLTFSESPAPLIPHQNNGHSAFQKPLFENRLFFSSTEVSPHFPGYMEGAVYSATQVTAAIMKDIR